MTAEDVSVVAHRARTNLALLIRLAEAEQRGERGFTNPELDTDAWWAIEHLLITTRQDVTSLWNYVENLHAGRSVPARELAEKRGAR